MCLDEHGKLRLIDNLHPSIHPQDLFTMLEDDSTPDCVRNYDNMKLVFT